MLSIICFGSYRLHSFVFDNTSSFLNLMPQNMYNMLATSITNKILVLNTRFQYKISRYMSLYKLESELTEMEQIKIIKFLKITKYIFRS